MPECRAVSERHIVAQRTRAFQVVMAAIGGHILVDGVAAPWYNSCQIGISCRTTPLAPASTAQAIASPNPDHTEDAATYVRAERRSAGQAYATGFQSGAKVLRSRMMTIRPMAIPMTVRGPTLMPFSFSVSKYLMRPAEDWKPVSFFLAMRRTMEDSHKKLTIQMSEAARCSGAGRSRIYLTTETGTVRTPIPEERRICHWFQGHREIRAAHHPFRSAGVLPLSRAGHSSSCPCANEAVRPVFL